LIPIGTVVRFGTLGLCILSLTACGAADDKTGQKRGEPEVGFIVAVPGDVPVTTTLGGRTVAFETSEVRPQVNGIIRSRNFTEGSFVRAGQPLFQIDASLYRAAADQASANLASARAAADAAVARADRYRPLVELEAVSQQDYTDAQAQARQARAAVAQNAAALETARINLRYTTVPAPIGGRIGRSLVTVGGLVSANQAEPLAVIQRIDPIHVDMQQSSAELVALKNSLARGGALPGRTDVRLKLEDGSLYPFVGTVQFSEVTVNEATGTVTLRARFPNPQALILPGTFVQASFEQALETNVFRVPQAGLQRDFGGDSFVLVVGKDNTVERRKVRATRTVGTDWVVTEGLVRGDRIIVQAPGTLKAGTRVKPVPASTPQKVGLPAQGTAASTGRGN